ncbi:MAG: U32 family peptidase [Clostridia bacterium]|nr:U32 family peptidase [Clostridia bacterium]
MKKPELLSPVGDFECLKAAVQNGADSVYLGASSFNARARATNFNETNLKEAVNYAKLHNVKVNLTLNTLIKNEEFEDAVKLAVFAYNIGVDAIIIQDLGLSNYLLKKHPEIPLHASTQMTVHNLAGVQNLENQGFSRVVLSRELDVSEIKYIKENTNCELEVFIHGALCISYSGGCLFSSMVGDRSGNRGLCAQPCRLPYELVNSKNEKISSGFLLSPRDLCALDYLPALVRAGIDCFKIEGRLKTPTYVATVTRIYRKYIDFIIEHLDLSDEEIISLMHKELEKINDATCLSDKEELLQSFNRGGFSNGHLSTDPNRNLVFKGKSNNEGIFLGKVFKFNANKGHVSFELENSLAIGDRIRIGDDLYTVSELMVDNKNFKSLPKGKKVTIGRMKGDIKVNSKIYKMESKALNEAVSPTFSQDKEFKKIPLHAEVRILKDKPVKLTVIGLEGFYKGLEYSITSEFIPEAAINMPLSKEKIVSMVSKTGNTEFEFTDIKIELDDGLFIPKISILNDMRRTALSNLEQLVLKKYNFDIAPKLPEQVSSIKANKTPKLAMLLNIINLEYNYLNLEKIDAFYIPFRFWNNSKYQDFLKALSKKFRTYIYMPTIIKDGISKGNLENQIKNIILNFSISGAVISHISQIDLFKNYSLDLIGNYNLNIFNTFSATELKEKGFNRFIPSVELNKAETQELLNQSPIGAEVIVYGKIPLMTNNYCYLGESNKCYKECYRKCMLNEKFELKDRLGFKFRIIPDNTCTLTTIFNSKTTSITYDDLNIDFARIDILDENFEEIKNIISTVKSGRRFDGKDFTNGKMK